jgi:hypothetical protein
MANGNRGLGDKLKEDVPCRHNSSKFGNPMKPRCKLLSVLLAIAWLTSCEEQPVVSVPTGASGLDTTKRSDSVPAGPSVPDTTKPTVSVPVEPSIYKKLFVEFEYENHAWSDSHDGYFIDSLGNVIRYDLIPPGVKWDSKSDWKPNASETYTEGEILAKIHHADTVIRRLSVDTLKLLQTWVFDTSEISFPDTGSAGADMGTSKYFKYLYQEDSQKYKRVPLGIHGDVEMISSQASANKIVALVDSIMYKYFRELVAARKP